MANAIDRTESGWPDAAYKLMTYTGPRSGYPVDLVSELLCKALSMVAMCRLVFDRLPEHRVLADGTASGAVWGIHGLLDEAQAIITCDNVADEAKAEAA